MRIMAGKTIPRQYRCMSESVVGEFVLVATEAQRDAGLLQHLGVVGVMGIMARQALTRRHGGMNVFLFEQLPMARVAQIWQRVLEEHSAIRLMGQMT